MNLNYLNGLILFSKYLLLAKDLSADRQVTQIITDHFKKNFVNFVKTSSPDNYWDYG